MVALVIALCGRADAGYQELDEGWRIAAEGRVDTSWAPDLIAGVVDGVEAQRKGTAPADDSASGVSASDSPRRFAQAGDFIDRYWYELADKWQYYYLDHCQYNLMGGLSYLLGHPCYPKLFERPIEQAVGFGGRVHVFWYGICSYLPVEGGYAWPYYGHGDFQWLASMPCAGRGLPFSGGGLRFSQTAGDYIDRWRYRYLDNWLYRDLDGSQYNMLGGLSYMFGRAGYSLPGVHSSFWRQRGWVDVHRVPEPSAFALFALGVLATKRSRTRGCQLQGRHN
jgi:hypothetical protein